MENEHESTCPACGSHKLPKWEGYDTSKCVECDVVNKDQYFINGEETDTDDI